MSQRTVRISTSAYCIVGLSDMGRYPDLTRGGGRGKWIELTGEEDALRDLATELYDRATEGEGGFDESPKDKAAAARALKSFSKQGIEMKGSR